MQVPPFSLTDQLADLGSELDDAVLRVLRSGQYIGGTEIKTFEDAFAASVNCRHAVGCNSGTDALVLALRGLGIGSGDEVITASFSFFATAEAISAVGATPVFVDVDPVTYLIDLNLIEAAITPATRVLLPVHLFGRPVNMARITDIAQRHRLKVVEDCAHALGIQWEGQQLGRRARVAPRDLRHEAQERQRTKQGRRRLVPREIPLDDGARHHELPEREDEFGRPEPGEAQVEGGPLLVPAVLELLVGEDRKSVV